MDKLQSQFCHRLYVYTLKLCWRCRHLILFITFALLIIVLILIRLSPNTSNLKISVIPSFETSEEIYNNDVLRRWYNFTGDNAWYNDKYLSPSNQKEWERYLRELRQNWILWKYNESRPYVLKQPEVEDPSMGQARVIREITNDKRNGFFVECGAYDGETRSNTLVLERFFGWMGLLIEADPLNFSKMIGKNRRAFLSPTCLSVQPRPMMASFLMADNVGRIHSSNDSDNSLDNTKDVAHKGNHIKVQCFPFAHYLAALDIKTVDYFSLDIEGSEIEVLETIPFDKLDIKTLSVEHVHNAKGRKYLIDLMETRGYYVHSFVERTDHLANDVIFVKHE